MGRTQDRFADLLRGLAERIDESPRGLDALLDDLALDLDLVLDWCPYRETGEGDSHCTGSGDGRCTDRRTGDWRSWYGETEIGSGLSHEVGRAMWDDIHEASMMHAVTLTRIARRYGFGGDDG